MPRVDYLVLLLEGDPVLHDALEALITTAKRTSPGPVILDEDVLSRWPDGFAVRAADETLGDLVRGMRERRTGFRSRGPLA